MPSGAITLDLGLSVAASGAVAAPVSGAVQVHLWTAVQALGSVVNPTPALDLTQTPRYIVTLTGALDSTTDLLLPARSIQGRYREDGSGYGSVVIPAAEQYADAVDARPNGELVVTFVQGDLSEEMLRFDPTELRLDVGPRSASLTISGSFDADLGASNAVELQDVTYINTTNGVPRYRAASRGAVRPGDTVIYQGAEHVASEVVWSISTDAVQMEVEC